MSNNFGEAIFKMQNKFKSIKNQIRVLKQLPPLIVNDDISKISAGYQNISNRHAK